ncbi:MAG: hypothetical protein ACOX2O_05010 [Bdellovibrionota bacterium]|jgi:acetylglutamate kinase
MTDFQCHLFLKQHEMELIFSEIFKGINELGDANSPQLHSAQLAIDNFMLIMCKLQKYAGQRIVIKMGGSLTDTPLAVRSLAIDVLLLKMAGLFPVIVNGGGKAINRKTGVSNPVKIAGYRVTDEHTAKLVDQVLLEVSNEIANAITTLAKNINTTVIAQSFRGSDVFRCKAREVFLPDGSKADLQYVGKVTDAKIEAIIEVLNAGGIPVVGSSSLGGDHKIYNCNADDAAATLGAKINAERLIYLTEAEGILDASCKLCSNLTPAQVSSMLKSGELSEQILPKLEGVLDALEYGIGAVSVIDGRVRHNLLLDLLLKDSSHPFGTNFTK